MSHYSGDGLLHSNSSVTLQTASPSGEHICVLNKHFVCRTSWPSRPPQDRDFYLHFVDGEAEAKERGLVQDQTHKHKWNSKLAHHQDPFPNISYFGEKLTPT